MGRHLRTAAAVAAAAALLAPAMTAATAATPATTRVGNAVVLGSTSGPADVCGALTAVQTGSGSGGVSYTSPMDGVITSFSHGAGPAVGVSVRLLVVRRSSTNPNAFTVTAKTALQPVTPDTLNSWPIRIPIATGQQLGVQVTPDNASCFLRATPNDVVSFSTSFDPDSSSELTTTDLEPGDRLNLSAVVEPDADRDGYGDVTQDLCPQSAATQQPCPAPDTIIVKRPKRVTTQRKITITFTASIPGGSFVCAVDSRRPVPCTSPLRKRFSYGKHTVVITAISTFGIADPTPASVRFKVKRPR